MSIVPEADVLAFLERSADDSYGNVSRIHLAVEQFVKTFTGRSWETATFSETLFHNETSSIFTKEFPITQINRLAVGSREVMQIKNTNEFSTAIVNVTSTAIDLNYNGTSATFTFSANATVADLVTSINAGGNGWNASATLGTYLSTEVIALQGESAINNNVVSVTVPNQGSTGLHVSVLTGEITRVGGFQNTSDARFDPEFVHGVHGVHDGHLNSDWFGDFGVIHITYIAGYSTANMPKDLQLAIMTMIDIVYGKLTNNELGLDSMSFAGMSKKFLDMPQDVKAVLFSYKSQRL